MVASLSPYYQQLLLGLCLSFSNDNNVVLRRLSLIIEVPPRASVCGGCSRSLQSCASTGQLAEFIFAGEALGTPF